MSRLLERIVRASARRPGRVLAVVAVLTLVSAALALRLDPSAATDTLAGRSADSFKATERYRERFGEESIVVLVQDDLSNLVLTQNLNTLVGLEGCLSGNKPPDREAPGGPGSPCDELARSKPVKVVYGPGTFINSAVGEIQEQLQKRSAEKAAEAERAAEAALRLARAQGRSPAQQRKAAQSARQLVYAEFVRDLLQLNLRYGRSEEHTSELQSPMYL